MIFREEHLEFLKAFNIEYDERYIYKEIKYIPYGETGINKIIILLIYIPYGKNW